MVRVLTSHNTEILRHLGSPAFQRLDIEHVASASYEQLWNAIAEIPPDVAIIDEHLDGRDGFELCRALKDHQQLAAVRVLMALPAAVDRATLDRVKKSGCDDVLVLPVQTDEFYHHIAQLANLPIRRHHRVGVTLELVLPTHQSAVAGTIDNVTPQGMGAYAPVDMRTGMDVLFRIRHDGLVTPESHGTVTWVEPCAPGESLFGLTLAEHSPIQTQLLLERLALFDITSAPVDSPMRGGVSVTMQGDFNELTCFDELAARLVPESRIDFHMAAVRYISSAGMKSWCGFLAGLEGKHYLFRHVSFAFNLQAAMVPMVLGSGRVHSLEAPYACESCEREELRLLEVNAIWRDGPHITPPGLTCRACGGELLFDGVPNRYFAFMCHQA